MQKIIFFELNEVPWKVMDWYKEKRPDSNIVSLLNEAKGYRSSSPDSGHLSPWITWPTLHRGVNNDKHHIHHLGENFKERDKEFPPIWDILVKNGVKVGMAGSLHSQTVPENTANYSFYVPDVFAIDSKTFPSSLEPFQAASLNLTQKNARNVSSKMGLKNIAGLVRTTAAIGLSANSIGHIASQLSAEITDKSKLARRRALQSLLYFDIFKKYVAKSKPDYTCFFTNHVAAAMHRFWAATFKDDYKDFNLTDQWCEQYKDELLWSMDIADYMIGWMMKFCRKNPEYKLLICSSMGQEASTAEIRSGIYNMTDLDKFFKVMGISSDEWKSRMAMAPDISASLTPDAYDRLKATYKKFLINGEPFDIEFQDEYSVHFRCALSSGDADIAPHKVTVDGTPYNLHDVGITFVADQNLVATTAYHMPEGIFLDWSPNYQAPEKAINSKNRVEIINTDILPAILDSYGINKQGYMQSSNFKVS